MNINEYYTMEKYEKDYWWHRGRIDIVRQQLSLVLSPQSGKKARILNIGCGTGGTVPMLSSFGDVYNVDTEPLAVRLLVEKGYKGTVVDGLKLPYKDNYFDAIVAMDVLEHIEEEHTALTEWKRVLKKNGQIIITVPAYSWLWSSHDVALHHQRRYNKAQGKVAIERSGLVLEKRSYMISFSLILVTLFRFKSKLSRSTKAETSYVDLPKPINGLFSWFLAIESLWLKRFNLPWGTSLLIRARKK